MKYSFFDRFLFYGTFVIIGILTITYASQAFWNSGLSSDGTITFSRCCGGHVCSDTLYNAKDNDCEFVMSHTFYDPPEQACFKWYFDGFS